MGDVTRRRVLQAGAWSVPVVALAVAAPSAAASTAAPLSARFDSPATTRVRSGGAGEIRIDYVETLVIRNENAFASTLGYSVTLNYDETLVNLEPTAAGIDVGGAQGALVLALPAINAGDALEIRLGASWLSSGFDTIGSGQTTRTWTALVTRSGHPDSATTASAVITIDAGPPV